MKQPIVDEIVPKYFLDFQTLVIGEFQKINNRLDNLVKVNNLKE
jgi:hypothetical protein